MKKTTTDDKKLEEIRQKMQHIRLTSRPQVKEMVKKAEKFLEDTKDIPGRQLPPFQILALACYKTGNALQS